MFKDVNLAREEMSSYKALRRDNGKFDKIDLNVNVLSAAAWPTYPDIPVNVPFDIAAVIDRYDKHYKHKHTGRRLTWKHALAHCIIRAHFPRGSKEVVVSSFQAIVLYRFNDRQPTETINYKDIKSETGLCE